MPKRPPSNLQIAMASRSKYSNKKTLCRAEHLHDSKKEAAQCDDLHLLLKGKQISELTQQPVFDIIVNGKKICTYRADFGYRDMKTGERFVLDVKGMKTAVYRLKKKLMLAVWGIEIKET